MPSAHYASRRGSSTLHIITGVASWYSGMTLTTECGVKRADVLEVKADRARLDPRACKRCLRTLGWDLVPRKATKN